MNAFSLSNYNVPLHGFPTEGKIYIYNTLYNTSVVLSEKEYEMLHEISSRSNETFVSELHVKALVDLGILLRSNVDELQLLKNRFAEMKEKKAVLNVIILTTYACNLNCSFCMEDGVKHNVHMKQDQTDQVIGWLKQKIEDIVPQKVSIAFYGGEPTLNVKPIEKICANIQEVCKEKSIIFEAGMTTNGVLLTSALAEHLAKCGLSWAVIAFAGNKIVHDRLRPTLKGGGSFDTIIKNIESVSDKIEIILKAIYDDTNESSLLSLLDYLYERKIHTKILDIAFDPVVENISASRKGLTCGCCTYSESNLNVKIRLTKEAYNRGFPTNFNFSMGPCTTVMNRYHYTIDPAGNMYKCPAFVGHTDLAVGTIAKGENPSFETSLDSHPWTLCETCQFAPICGGGCRLYSLLKNGDITSQACELDYFESVGKEFMQMEYLRHVFANQLNVAI